MILTRVMSPITIRAIKKISTTVQRRKKSGRVRGYSRNNMSDIDEVWRTAGVGRMCLALRVSVRLLGYGSPTIPGVFLRTKEVGLAQRAMKTLKSRWKRKRMRRERERKLVYARTMDESFNLAAYLAGINSLQSTRYSTKYVEENYPEYSDMEKEDRGAVYRFVVI